MRRMVPSCPLCCLGGRSAQPLVLQSLSSVSPGAAPLLCPPKVKKSGVVSGSLPKIIGFALLHKAPTAARGSSSALLTALGHLHWGISATRAERGTNTARFMHSRRKVLSAPRAELVTQHSSRNHLAGGTQKLLAVASEAFWMFQLCLASKPTAAFRPRGTRPLHYPNSPLGFREMLLC